LGHRSVLHLFGSDFCISHDIVIVAFGVVFLPSYVSVTSNQPLLPCAFTVTLHCVPATYARVSLAFKHAKRNQLRARTIRKKLMTNPSIDNHETPR